MSIYFTSSSAESGDEKSPGEQKKMRVYYKAGDVEGGLLPPPIHVGKFLRLKKKDFKLPYDIHWLMENRKVLFHVLFTIINDNYF